MTIVFLLAVLWTNALLLGILILLWQVRRELKNAARRMRVDANITAYKTAEIATAVRDTGENSVLAVEDTSNART